MVAMIGVVSLLIQFSGESGVSYFFKMTVILLTGVWLAGEYNPGEFLNLGTWFLGNRTGFELGLLSEMAMQSFSSLFEDLDRIRLAFSFKGTPLNARTIIPAGTLLIYLELARAKDNADLLAVRGYRHGGTLQPAFKTPKKDIIAGLCAIPVLPIAIFPLVNFLYFNSVVLRGLI
jgi:energy-coupling factor transport system permease protein